MRSEPFRVLRPFAQRLSVAFFTKEDDHLSEEKVHDHLHAKQSASLSQVHGGRAVIFRESSASTIEADALATDSEGLALIVRVADCQSFVVYEPTKHVAGLIHAGWRGLLAGVIPSFFDLLFKEWQIRPEETFVGAAPSLCLACSRFTDPAKELPAIRSEFFSGNLVNLRAIAEDQLHSLGVRTQRFERMEGCTCCDARTYWSYRGGDREAVRKGMTNILACALTPLV